MNAPVLLTPSGKDYLWGGRRLKTLFNKTIDLDPLSETWECSTHKDGPSYVYSGPYKGLILKELLRIHPEYLGIDNFNTEGEIPILIKFIDAKKDLSVQVHPSDSYANEHENGQLGKTEMWFVLSHRKDASLVYGFKKDMTKKEVLKALKDNTLQEHLNKVKVKDHETYFIPSGTVHAIGNGIILMEIQENSNLTYRLYDYGRLGKDGKPRELHIQKALEVMNLKKQKEEKGKDLSVFKSKGFTEKELAKCPYFITSDLSLDTTHDKNLVDFQTGKESFEVLICYKGCGVILNQEEGFTLPFFQGDTIFFPADSMKVRLHGQANLIHVKC